MTLYYSVMLVLSVSYYLAACFYTYKELSKQGVKMNFYLVTTPGYLYYIARNNSTRLVRMVALSSVCAFLLVLVATGQLDS